MIGGSSAAAAARSPVAAAVPLQSPAHPVDTVVVDSPLPGGAAEVVRFLLNTVPPWVQIGGVILGAIVAAVAVTILFRRRHAVRAWLSGRTRAALVALAAVAVLLVAGIASAGRATWNFTQHDNAFCTGCHVMNPAFIQFETAESGHAELSCHACHQQPISASLRQLYLWIAERPQEIGEHARVANRYCEACHVTGDTATWQRIAATAGHRVHLESDSASLQDLQCVACHGVEIHRFTPAVATCGQSGCHRTEDTEIVLGRMAGQSVRHCTSCHAFTTDVPALATRDDARASLVPGGGQCLGCHEMRAVLPDFDADRDPHRASCGACHNPHVDRTPDVAATTCATSGCHANWRDEPFHSGVHRRVAEQCLTCHQPHQAKVDASACQACHEGVRARGMFRAPLPFDTAAALRRSRPTSLRQAPGTTAELAEGSATSPTRARSRHDVLPARPSAQVRHVSLSTEAPIVRRHRSAPLPHGGRAAGTRGTARVRVTPPHATGINGVSLLPPIAGAPLDTFPHARHERLACLVCHQTGRGHGQLTFEPPRGCLLCHHQDPSRARCESCHRIADFGRPRTATVTVAVRDHAPRPRSVTFLHEHHTSRRCVDCHTTPVTLTPAPAKAQCSDCHAEHHANGRSCATCHGGAEPRLAHPSGDVAHQRCDACHTRTTIERLTPTRDFCTNCHVDVAPSHYASRECTVCHFLAEPDLYRPKLLSTPRP